MSISANLINSADSNDSCNAAWLKRPVFVAQCHTWALAAKLNLCTHRFRCLPASRDQVALAARKHVADVIRQERKRVARMKLVCDQLAVVGQHNPSTGFLVDIQATIDLRMELHRLQDMQDAVYKMLA